MLNCDKTEFLFVSNPCFHHSFSGVSLTIDDAVIQPSSSVRSLGVLIDSSLKMNPHVSSLSSSLHFHLSNIARIRPFLNQTACEHAVRAIITSRIDYANSLLFGTSSANIQRLQRAQNRAAKLVFLAKKKDHVTPLLRELHWLPVQKRISFKILTLTYKCMHNSAPSYLMSLIPRYESGRLGLRSGKDVTLLATPRNTSRAGDKSFAAAAPGMWNQLPRHIRESPSLAVFQQTLKTFFFDD